MYPTPTTPRSNLLRSILLLPLLFPALALAGHYTTVPTSGLTDHWIGYLSLGIFLITLLLVSLEEVTQMRKSKPMVVCAGLIWGLIAWHGIQTGTTHAAEVAVHHNLLQYAELLLLMLVVMTYINAMDERRVFHALRTWITHRSMSYRQLFWLTGLSAFLISPLLDNLSTALLIGMVVLIIGKDAPHFTALGCINVIVAANAGGAFSPFGDITTLMVWQQNIQSSSGILTFSSFFSLFLPALSAWLIPASVMQFSIPGSSTLKKGKTVRLRRGARRIMLLFLLTIATAVVFQGVLHLPAVIGMLTGLSYLQFFGYYLKRTHPACQGGHDHQPLMASLPPDSKRPYDVFARVARAEWDTLLFLYGIALSVGGLSYLGYLAMASELLYDQWGATTANIAVGLASSVLENIPTMYAVLAMAPEMTREEWLLVTLTAGIGGSLLSIGSAAGIALMGQARGIYTFFSHLRWTPVILLGYLAAVQLHLSLNAAYP
jgi:Na+/H+ antiporter NhaD/arsenite permease-like protein